MKTTAQKWGNSMAVRVPKDIAEKAGIKVKDPIDIEVVDGNIVLTPQLQRKYRLDELVKGITKENLHDEVDFGGPLGRERLSGLGTGRHKQYRQ